VAAARLRAASISGVSIVMRAEYHSDLHQRDACP
jgi:hypothetical protein